MIWQKGMEIWKETYLLTKNLPSEEKYGISSQINRASSSIPANIAEGSSRDSKKDYARFLQIALGSSFELETFLIGVRMLELVSSEEKVEEILNLIDEEQKMIMSFKKKIEINS